MIRVALAVIALVALIQPGQAEPPVITAIRQFHECVEREVKRTDDGTATIELVTKVVRWACRLDAHEALRLAPHWPEEHVQYIILHEVLTNRTLTRENREGKGK